MTINYMNLRYHNSLEFNTRWVANGLAIVFKFCIRAFIKMKPVLCELVLA